MKYLLFSVYFLFCLLSNAQDVKLNYSKGASILFFDIDSKTEKLSNKIGLSLNKGEYELQFGYLNSSFSYDGNFLEQQDLYKNYITEVQGAYIAYSHELIEQDKLKFSLGLELGFNQYSISTNLENNRGILYSDFEIDQWNELGYFSENNFETDMSQLNIDQLEDYNLNYFSFGPTIECSYQLVDNFEIFVKSHYRKNTNDLLDNVNIYNQRDIPSSNETDNQIDLMFGIKFQFNNKQAISNDSLVSLIDFITSDEPDTIIPNQNQVEVLEPVASVNNDVNEVKDNSEYILGFFDFNPDSINYTSSLKDEDFTEIQQTEIEEESLENENDIDDEIVEIQTIDALAVDNDSDINHYLIVGVFSSQSNSESFANFIEISPSNILLRNNMYYLYAMKSNNINEIRQLRDSFEYDSWVLSIE
ncbi:MAG: hypothetical protein P8I29_05155 [Flavobacteriales bacterium]|nr:hypothetical protein [Flavobacteriales bacterium]